MTSNMYEIREKEETGYSDLRDQIWEMEWVGVERNNKHLFIIVF